MSVINQMNRDLKRREAKDKQLAPVLTSVPWWHSPALYKSIFVLILVGLTVTSGYLLWFKEPAPSTSLAPVNQSETLAIKQDPQITSQAEGSLSKAEGSLLTSQVKPAMTGSSAATATSKQVNPPQTAQALDAQSQAMLAAVTLSNDSRIKVLDAKVVFISDSVEPDLATSSEQIMDDSKAQDIAQRASLAPSIAPTLQPSVIPSIAPKVIPSLAPANIATEGSTKAPIETPIEAPTEASTERAKEAQIQSAQQPVLEQKTVEPEPIAIVEVTKVQETSKSSSSTINALNSAESESTPVKVKPTPSGPSSLTIKPSNLTDAELIALYQKQAGAAKSKGDLASAQVRLQKALAIDPQHIEVRKDLAALHYGRGEYRQAMAVLDQGVDLVPSNADFRLMQARIYLAGQQQVEALTVLDAISPNVIHNQDFYATKAALAQQLNQDNKALEAYLALARTQPKQGKWWLGLAISQEKLGQREQALRSYQQAELVGGLSLASMDYVKGRIAGLQ